MLKTIRRSLKRLTRNTSGNATLIVAMGFPALIGAAGAAVDFSQWYT
ncbi:TadE/TadG family type IV pilus assembly protein [Novosphingobium sp.]